MLNNLNNGFELYNMKSIIRYFISGTVFIVMLIVMKIWYFDVHGTKETLVKPIVLQSVESKSDYIESKITLVFRYTPELSNHLIKTINSFKNIFPNISVLIVCDNPLNKKVLSNISHLKGQVDVVSLKLDLLNSNAQPCIGHYVKTEFILIVPVGVSSASEKTVYSLIKLLKSSKKSALSIPIKTVKTECLELDLHLMEWTIEYRYNYFNSLCDAVKGDHAILVYSKVLQRLFVPFMLPFPDSLYLQLAAVKIKVKLIENITFDYIDGYSPDVYQPNIDFQWQMMNKRLKIKKIIRETGVIEWYGCTKETFRCFGDIIDSVPDYIKDGRWTPPCCLKLLRETTRHVVKILKEYNVTFWLEGGSLLGAMRMKDIIPWDYDVDLGIYLNDVTKCPWLKVLHSEKMKEENALGVLDNDGYVWEKSRPEEGKFYRVHASARNRLHVDIFPFFSRDGIMTKETWFASHPQDKEFPEHYLQPLTTIEFAGIEIPAPNNIKEFLELKFGKGCVENPQYPHPEIYPFPDDLKKLVVFNETKYYEV